MIEHGNRYYLSKSYQMSIDEACQDAHVDSYAPHQKPRSTKEKEKEWDKRFVAALLERGLVIRTMTEQEATSCFPTMAPQPYHNGYPWPAYIMRVPRKSK